MKCTNEKWKLKKVLSCHFEEKSQKIKRNLPWMNLSLFPKRLGSAEETPNQRFEVHFVCVFREEKVCFEMAIYQLALCY